MDKTHDPNRQTCFELRAALDDLKLTQAALALLCGVKPVQVWRWCEGKAEVPAYVWSMLSLAKGYEIDDLVRGQRFSWKVRPEHIYRNGKSYKMLVKRFHPDVSGRDTTAEMQLINAARKA